MSLAQFIVAAVAQKISALRLARAFAAELAGSGQPEDLRNYRGNAPDRSPVQGDEIE